MPMEKLKLESVQKKVKPMSKEHHLKYVKALKGTLVKRFDDIINQVFEKNLVKFDDYKEHNYKLANIIVGAIAQVINIEFQPPHKEDEELSNQLKEKIK